MVDRIRTLAAIPPAVPVWLGAIAAFCPNAAALALQPQGRSARPTIRASRAAPLL